MSARGGEEGMASLTLSLARRRPAYSTTPEMMIYLPRGIRGERRGHVITGW